MQLLGAGSLDRISKKTFKAGQIIFHEGDNGNYAYIIEKGKVEIFRERNGKEEILETQNAYTVFGELALIDNKPRAASARAIEDTECITLDKVYIQEIIQNSDPSMQILVKLVMSIIRKHYKDAPLT